MTTQNPPAYGTTGGAFWPDTGTVPPYGASAFYDITRDDTDAYFITNAVPGDPIYPSGPPSGTPSVLGGTYIYIPSLAGRKLFQITWVGDAFDTVASGNTPKQARIRFAEGPTALVLNTATPFHVLEGGFGPCRVENIGGAAGTINTDTFVETQWTNMYRPFEYDATGTEFAFTLINHSS